MNKKMENRRLRAAYQGATRARAEVPAALSDEAINKQMAAIRTVLSVTEDRRIRAHLWAGYRKLAETAAIRDLKALMTVFECRGRPHIAALARAELHARIAP